MATSLPVCAVPILNLPIDFGKPKHLQHIPFYTEPTLSLEPEEMAKLFSAQSLAEKMVRVEQDQIIISQSAYWARVDIHNPTDFQQNITVFLNNPFLDSVAFSGMMVWEFMRPVSPVLWWIFHVGLIRIAYLRYRCW